jgi:hypothetical protein
MDSTMLAVLLFNTAVAGLIYLGFMIDRVRLGRVEAALEEERSLAATHHASVSKEVVRV